MMVLILGAAYGSYRAATDSVEAGRARLTAQQDARATMHRLVLDLRGAHRPKPPLPPPESGKTVMTAEVQQEAFEQDREPHFTGGTRARGMTDIEFISSAGIPAPDQPNVPLCRIAYRFQESTGILERGQAMYLGPRRDQEAKMNWVTVSYSVNDLEFEFLETEDRWVSGWNSDDEDDALPAAVRITLIMDGGDGPPITFSTITKVAHAYAEKEDE